MRPADARDRDNLRGVSGAGSAAKHLPKSRPSTGKSAYTSAQQAGSTHETAMAKIQGLSEYMGLNKQVVTFEAPKTRNVMNVHLGCGHLVRIQHRDFHGGRPGRDHGSGPRGYPQNPVPQGRAHLRSSQPEERGFV